MPQEQWLDRSKYLNINSSYAYEAYRDTREHVSIHLRTDGRFLKTIYHVHAMTEIIYIESGTADAVLDGRHYAMPAGSFCAVSSFTPHYFRAGESTSWLIMVPMSAMRRIMPQWEGKPFLRPVARDSGGEVHAVVALMHAIYRAEGIYADLKEEARSDALQAATAVLLHTVGLICGLGEHNSRAVLLLEVVEYLNSHFREPIRIEQLARRFLCNQNDLSSRFSHLFGQSISEYLNRLRAREAKRLLAENPDMILPEVAERAGFGSLRSLHRVYKEVYGSTPAAGKP